MIGDENTQTANRSQQANLADLLNEFSERVVSGAMPDIESYARRFPEMADDIRQMLGTMLALHRATHEAWDHQDSDAFHLGNQLGDFRLIREIGRGGMGVVYEAEQISLGRHVAIKVLPFAAVLGDKHLQRFKNEAHAAAQLHHEHIVPVYAIGCEKGVHYYAMQFIDGQTVGQLIREKKRAAELPAAGDVKAEPAHSARSSDEAGTEVPQSDSGTSTQVISQMTTKSGSAGSLAIYRGVAELGIRVADALHHAHECGVIHRDVKPSNLLLDEHGKVWVADFGLAQIQTAPDITHTGDILGTFRYMSPEQASGSKAAVDRHTDIYSLGATLYELLTLTPAVTGNGRAEILRNVLDQEPRRLRAVDARIPPDLETIVVKCLTKEPSDRYATAHDLALDLQRYLDDMPIQAQPPTWRKRGAKWMRRHRAWVASGGVVLVLALIGLSISTAWIWRSNRQTEHALREAEKNFWRAHELVDDYYQAINTDRMVDEPGMQPLRWELYEQARDYYLAFTRERGGDPRHARELASAYKRLGAIASDVGEPRESIGYYQRARQHLRVAMDRGEEYERDQFELAGIEIYLGVSHRKAGELEPAISELKRGKQRLERLLENRPDDDWFLAERAQAVFQVGVVFSKQDRLEEAAATMADAEKVLQTLVTQLPENVRHELLLVWVRIQLGTVLESLECRPEAMQSYSQAARSSRSLIRRHPGLVSARERLAVSLHGIGSIHFKTGEPDEALAAFGEAKQILESIALSNPRQVMMQLSLANVHSEIANVYRWLNRIDDAISAYEEGIAVLDIIEFASPDPTLFEETVATIEHGLGGAYLDRRDTDQAIVWLNKALERRKTLNEILATGESRKSLSECQSVLGMAYRRQGDLELAIHHATAACEIDEQIIALQPENGHAHGGAGGHRSNLGILYAGSGRHEEAIAEFRKAIEHQRKSVALLPDLVQYGNFLANQYCNLAISHSKAEDWQDAISAYREGVDVREKLMRRHPQDPGLVVYAAQNYLQLAQLQRHIEDIEPAHSSFCRAVELYEQLPEATRRNADIARALQQGQEGRAKTAQSP